MAKRREKIDRDGNNGAGWYIPNVVSNSAAWRSMSLPEFRLITIAASLFNPREANNGYIALSFQYLKQHFGWGSEQTLVNARKSLCDKGLLVLTKQGDRTNVPSLYALTWLPVKNRPDGPRLSIDAIEFNKSHRGAYIRWQPTEKPLRGKAKLLQEKRLTISAGRSAESTNSAAGRSAEKPKTCIPLRPAALFDPKIPISALRPADTT